MASTMALYISALTPSRLRVSMAAGRPYLRAIAQRASSTTLLPTVVMTMESPSPMRLLMMSRMSVCCSICSLDMWVEMSTRQYTVVGSFS